MRLTPTERDRLLLFSAAELARARRARGLRLNVPEATALIADTVAEAARDGLRLAAAIEAGRSLLGPDDVLPGVPSVVTEVQVEAVFEDGTRLAVVTDPFGPVDTPGPGDVLPGPRRLEVEYADLIEVEVTNTATVPISVTSHFHFFEVNPRLSFDRAAAYGRRAAIPAGSTIRFDPDASVTVPLTSIGGDRIVIGFAGLVDGPLDAPGAREEALRRARACGYLDTAEGVVGKAAGDAAGGAVGVVAGDAAGGVVGEAAGDAAGDGAGAVAGDAAGDAAGVVAGDAAREVVGGAAGDRAGDAAMEGAR